MLFCPKCGSILMPKKQDRKRVMACSCGYVNRNVDSASVTEEVRNRAPDVEVIEKGEKDTLPLTEATCDTCGHTQARYWTVQTRAGDEAETKFLRCDKCDHTWRDYG